jgi:hypothetical protein
MAPMNHPGDTTDVFYRDQAGVQNVDKITASGTRWVRLWARWDKLEVANGVYDTAAVANLDQQILRLRQLGIGVVLVSYYFPRWVNGTQNLTPEQANNYKRDYRTYRDGSGALKQLEWEIPLTQLGVNSVYGRWINFLITRYKQYGCGVVLELMNEPNYQMWPQRNGIENSSPLIIQNKVAEMMYTAHQISAFHGHQMPIAAPAAADFRRGSTRYETELKDFIPALKTALNSYNNFRGGPTFMWTQHNYTDVETFADMGQLFTRAHLLGWWRGWSATNSDGSNPAIWLTEGGARPSKVSPSTYERQAEAVAAAWARLQNAAGVEMFTNYLLHSTWDYDTGLRDPMPGVGTLRPVGHRFHGFPGR